MNYEKGKCGNLHRKDAKKRKERNWIEIASRFLRAFAVEMNFFHNS
jgi:hypothetical protein